MEAGGGSQQGPVTCGSWIRRPDNVNFVVLGTSRRGDSSPSLLQIFSFDTKITSLSSSPLTTYVLEEVEGDPVSIAVHPNGDDFVCSTTRGGCKLFELYGGELNAKLLAKELPLLRDVGPQKCLAFSVDGSKLATGGEDGHLRILEWPSLAVILDEPRAHRSIRDIDFSLDTEFLASTSDDGSARIWKIEDGVPLTTLARKSDENIELCRFSKDGTKPFLFCTVQKGEKAVTAVWDMSTWNRIGHKKLLGKPASVMSISKDGKYLALGSRDGDICVVEVKKMEIYHRSKRLHLGNCIGTLDFCPSERVVLTTSNEWGAVVTKLNVPADWKEWQIYLLLLGLFLASAVVFYIFFQNSESFWKFPVRKDQAATPKFEAFVGDSQSSDNPFGPVDMKCIMKFLRPMGVFWKEYLPPMLLGAAEKDSEDQSLGKKVLGFGIVRDSDSRHELPSEPSKVTFPIHLSFALPFQSFKCHQRNPPCSVITLGVMNTADLRLSMAVKATSGSTSSAEISGANVEEEKSETYSNNMTEAMGAVLTYRHELGMNYNFIRPDLIVGSCLQSPYDVDKLRAIGVKTIFCMQQDSDLEYFGVDIGAIRDYAKTFEDVEHLRAEIRDFDAYDLRIRLPAVVGKLYKAINRNGGVTYVHCTAGLGRAPAVALAYMFWVQGYKLSEAHNLLLRKRSCFPKLDAIKSATADILTGLRKKLVTLTWEDNNCSTVEISGLDIGWGQRIPLKFDEEQGLWILKRELPEGHYEYKYIIDGGWTCNKYELVTSPNKDGHVNNFVQVVDDDSSSVDATLRKRLTSDDPDLTTEERLKVRQFLEAYSDSDE
ncbi:hypothetical protein FNV43_RR25222 [Rhamnella rubrinervis]|uniref:Dual specificity protein phosphatase 4 n=1 Tax=Rhamnella rubrinervis TaxID=2594499 RepID=A0A8K0DU53_9ROSA|nr:hypothetical protein FNV43_RR25222 [Rhamnella rubrinervis]